MTMTTIGLAAVLAVSIGIFIGIIGGGGGGLYIIALILFLKLDVKTAVGTALILSTITLASASWQYGRRKLVRWDYVVAISAPGLVGVLGGSWFMRSIDELVLKAAIILVFAVSGVSSLLKVRSRAQKESDVGPAARKLPILIPMGIVGGVITGALGLSGAVPMSSLLVGLLGFSPELAIGTTMLIALVVNSAGALFHLAEQHVAPWLVLIFGAGSVLGTFVGVPLAVRINRKVLTIILGALTIGSGIYLAVK